MRPQIRAQPPQSNGCRRCALRESAARKHAQHAKNRPVYESTGRFWVFERAANRGLMLSLRSASEVFFGELPVDELFEEGLDEGGARIAVIDVVGVFPVVDREDRRFARLHRRTRIARIHDGERAVGLLYEPGPARTEVASRSGRERFDEGFKAPPGLFDRFEERTLRAAAARGGQALPKEGVVEVLRGVVEKTAFGAADDFFEGLAFETRTRKLVVEVRHIGAVMLAPVVFERFAAHGGLERIDCVGQFGKLKFGHGRSPLKYCTALHEMLAEPVCSGISVGAQIKMRSEAQKGTRKTAPAVDASIISP